MTQTATATQAIANLKAALAKIETTQATTKCCVWCGFGDHYTDEIFNKNGAPVAHCSKGCEHDATGCTDADVHDDSLVRHVQGECGILECLNA